MIPTIIVEGKERMAYDAVTKHSTTNFRSFHMQISQKIFMIRPTSRKSAVGIKPNKKLSRQVIPISVKLPRIVHFTRVWAARVSNVRNAKAPPTAKPQLRIIRAINSSLYTNICIHRESPTRSSTPPTPSCLNSSSQTNRASPRNVSAKDIAQSIELSGSSSISLKHWSSLAVVVTPADSKTIDTALSKSLTSSEISNSADKTL
mmetsp:Transcript_9210/g.12189  ORF Transcript_9210/g.12189 Transcript_9210/m.12189 type:complete len:204 (+) Transcript_9210:1199-1810(+)